MKSTIFITALTLIRLVIPVVILLLVGNGFQRNKEIGVK